MIKILINIVVTTLLIITYGYKQYNNGIYGFKDEIKMHNNKNIISVPNVNSRFYNIIYIIKMCVIQASIYFQVESRTKRYETTIAGRYSTYILLCISDGEVLLNS